MTTRRLTSLLLRRPLQRGMRYIKHLMVVCLAIFAVHSCDIEPPLRLANPKGTIIQIGIPSIITDLNVIWNIDADWKKSWYYGWDATDTVLWGPIGYFAPSNYEVRRYLLGKDPSITRYLECDAFTIYGNSFQRNYEFAYYDLLLWSNIDSDDGTQTVIINEDDRSNIFATTSKTRVNYANMFNNQTPQQRTRVVNTHNQPEIFYSSSVYNFYISDKKEDYDVVDEEKNLWFKYLHTELNPVVYIYLVQVILHNNRNRIVNMAESASFCGLADGVNLHTGVTSNVDANVTFDMRLKQNIDVRGEKCDIFGTKLTTYGLCDMQPWNIVRADPLYAGSRTDLTNNVMLNFKFVNQTDSVYVFDVTNQVRRQAHGGVITIEIDADTLHIPVNPNNHGSAFKPWVSDYGDSITHEFNL